MKKEIGELRFPIWMLGDSEPNQWKDRLDDPLDKRHPSRHNIWTSILDVIQGEVFIALGKRVDADRMYLRNAVQNAVTKPSKPFSQTLIWHKEAVASLAEYTQLIEKYKPPIVLTFGWFAFAFGLRANGEVHQGWSRHSSQTALLGDEFRRRIAEFNINRTNIIPLLHRSIAGGNFLSGHTEFCGATGANYFDEVGESLARIIVQNQNQLDCWTNPPITALPPSPSATDSTSAANPRPNRS